MGAMGTMDTIDALDAGGIGGHHIIIGTLLIFIYSRFRKAADETLHPLAVVRGGMILWHPGVAAGGMEDLVSFCFQKIEVDAKRIPQLIGERGKVVNALREESGCKL